MKKKVFKKPRNLKMSRVAENALKNSIVHWEGVRDDNESTHRSNCPLCKIYYNESFDSRDEDAADCCCRGCPIYINSGFRYCERTPFQKYDNRPAGISEPKRKRLAQAEIDFLRSCYY